MYVLPSHGANTLRGNGKLQYFLHVDKKKKFSTTHNLSPELKKVKYIKQSWRLNGVLNRKPKIHVITECFHLFLFLAKELYSSAWEMSASNIERKKERVNMKADSLLFGSGGRLLLSLYKLIYQLNNTSLVLKRKKCQQDKQESVYRS